MKANTRLFGEIDIDEEKIITLENGMIGFPDLRKFTLIFDKEKKEHHPRSCGFSPWMNRKLHFRSCIQMN